jgi:hypothetical protein
MTMSFRLARRAIAAFVATAAVAGACGEAAPREQRRAACYPPCLAAVVERCPLVAGCTVGEEPDSAVGEARGETQGVATCFASGEKMRYGTSLADGAEHHPVKASDGSLCYEAVGTFPRYEIFVGTELVATFDDARASGTVTVTCDGEITTIRPRATGNPDCGRLPWDPARTCAPGEDCTFGGG